jgi:hypothetical protein
MSALGNIVQRCISAVEVPGYAIKIHHAVEHGVPMVLADREINKMAVREFLTIKIKAAIGTKGGRAERHEADYVMAHREDAAGGGISAMVPRQGDLFIDPFGLRDGYVLDGGAVEMKRTRYLTQPEFRGLRRLRRKSWVADGRHLKLLDDVDEMLAPVWDNDPEMTYEEACALFVRHYGRPDLPDDDGDGE